MVSKLWHDKIIVIIDRFSIDWWFESVGKFCTPNVLWIKMIFPNCQENEWKPGKVLKKHINLVFSPTIKDSNVRQVNIGGQSLVKIEHDWTWLDQNNIFQVQVNLFQKYLFTCQLTHNMTTNCSMIYKFSTRKFQEQNMSRTCQEHVMYLHKLFWMYKQKL